LRELDKACRQAGARVTHQRREVLRSVVKMDAHPDAQSVLQRVRQRMPTISFDTVYRTLSFLEQHNLINRVHATGERARFDGNHALHHHFICTKCGKIIDFESKQLDEMQLRGGVESLGTAASRQLQVLGICRDCER
jgi:Fur family transcriptional regulator, peroxide stress response regulator